jgi:uncharacterized protein YqiB (DUF1249 family)
MILTSHHDPHSSLQDLSGTFAGLMDLYERNYIGIRRLVPRMPAAGTSLISQVPGGLSLYLDVIERFPYTTELVLTYHFFRDGYVLTEPNLRIRVYQDARLAEVMSAHLRHWPEFEATEGGWNKTRLRSRWHVNRFLYKWLSYCLHQGHRFEETVP